MSNEAIDQFIRAVQSRLERLLDLMIEDKIQVLEGKKNKDNTKDNTGTTQKLERLYTLKGDFTKTVHLFKELCDTRGLSKTYKHSERAWLVKATEEQLTKFEQELATQKIDYEIVQEGST